MRYDLPTLKHIKYTDCCKRKDQRKLPMQPILE